MVMPGTPAGDAGERNGTDVAASTVVHPTAPLPLAQLCAQIHGKLAAFLNADPKTERLRAVQAQSRISLGVIEEALRRYSPEELSISYNGGKDCLVLLILYLSALHSYHARPVDGLHTSNKTNNHHQHHPPPARLPTRLNSVYIVTQHPFQAVEDFVASSVEYYHLSMTRYAKPMKEGFADYLREHPKIRAIFVGTRRTDPHGGELVHFDPTDRGWPDFMRIHPVIDWHYAEIWAFIRELGITYCELYDMGYTSLGGTTDTQPNPALGVGSGGFRPAYELLQDEEERLGRNR